MDLDTKLVWAFFIMTMLMFFHSINESDKLGTLRTNYHYSDMGWIDEENLK